jgi:hypothetical protein
MLSHPTKKAGKSNSIQAYFPTNKAENTIFRKRSPFIDFCVVIMFIVIYLFIYKLLPFVMYCCLVKQKYYLAIISKH